jgi:hypothetical protein
LGHVTESAGILYVEEWIIFCKIKFQSVYKVPTLNGCYVKYLHQSDFKTYHLFKNAILIFIFVDITRSVYNFSRSMFNQGHAVACSGRRCEEVNGCKELEESSAG